VIYNINVLSLIKIYQTTSEMFTVETVLKQGDALSPILFNRVLEKAAREMQKDATGVDIN